MNISLFFSISKFSIFFGSYVLFILTRMFSVIKSSLFTLVFSPFISNSFLTISKLPNFLYILFVFFNIFLVVILISFFFVFSIFNSSEFCFTFESFQFSIILFLAKDIPFVGSIFNTIFFWIFIFFLSVFS